MSEAVRASRCSKADPDSSPWLIPRLEFDGNPDLQELMSESQSQQAYQREHSPSNIDNFSCSTQDQHCVRTEEGTPTSRHSPAPESLHPHEHLTTKLIPSTSFKHAGSPKTNKMWLLSQPVNASESFQLRRHGSRVQVLDISLACLSATIPMITLAIGMLAIVFKNSLSTSNAGDELFGTEEYYSASCNEPSYIVDFSAIPVAFVASLISKVATYSSVPLMTLLSFKVARVLMQTSTEPHPNRLPSPFQIGLLISILSGGATSMWDSTKYAVEWRGKRVRMPYVAKMAVVALSCIMVLSLLCQLADAWFHRGTQSIIYTSISTSPSISFNSGRILSSECRQYYQNGTAQKQLSFNRSNRSPSPSERLPCNIRTSHQGYYPEKGWGGLQLTTGATKSNNVTSVDYNGEKISLLVPSTPPQFTDWRANTIGTSTTCFHISKGCFIGNESDFSLDYFCQNFTGMTVLDGIDFHNGHSRNVQFDQYIFQPKDHQVVTKYNLTNPYFFVFSGTVSNDAFEDSTINPHNVSWVTENGFGFLATCNSSVYDITYRSVNQTITIESRRPSNLDVAQSVSGAMVLAEVSVPVSIYNGMSMSMTTAQSGTDAANNFGEWYSKISMAYSTGALEEVPSLTEQRRTTLIVTCVPKAALWTLISLTVVYVVLGIALTVTACLAGNVGSVQAQLSVAGLAAASFEEPDPGIDTGEKEEGGTKGDDSCLEKLFEEYRQEKGTRSAGKRVGFEPIRHDRWQYTLLKE